MMNCVDLKLLNVLIENLHSGRTKIIFDVVLIDQNYLEYGFNLQFSYNNSVFMNKVHPSKKYSYSLDVKSNTFDKVKFSDFENHKDIVKQLFDMMKNLFE